jgi:hypothetical protein
MFTITFSAYWMEIRRASQTDREQQGINLLIRPRALLVQITLKLLRAEVKESDEFYRLLGKDKNAS